MSSRRRSGDASFLIGIILGIVVGAAIAVIISEATQGDTRSLEDGVEKAKDSLETRPRITGAADGASPA